MRIHSEVKISSETWEDLCFLISRVLDENHVLKSMHSRREVELSDAEPNINAPSRVVFIDIDTGAELIGNKAVIEDVTTRVWEGFQWAAFQTSASIVDVVVGYLTINIYTAHTGDTVYSALIELTK